MTEHRSCFARMFASCGSWFPGYAQGLGRKCRAVLQQVKRAPGHMIISTPPCSSLPFSLFPHYYQNVKKAYYSYCQGNYLLFQIQRGVWHNFHDHSCCCLKKNETQCLVCPPPPPGLIASSMAQLPLIILLHSIFIMQELLPSLRAATFSTMWLSCTQPPKP